MTEKIITTMLLIIALIHLLPVSGVLGPLQLETLYGIAIDNNNEEILMRHRAVLFGILGMLFIYAAFRPAFQPFAFLVAFISIASFLVLAASAGPYNGAIRRVVLADVVAAVCLLIATVSYYFQSQS